MTNEQAHNNLKNLIFNGRILINGLPLTANEISALIQSEQVLFDKAMQFDKAQKLVTAKAAVPVEGTKQENVPVNNQKKGN